jgi:hypothetical protein
MGVCVVVRVSVDQSIRWTGAEGILQCATQPIVCEAFINEVIVWGGDFHVAGANVRYSIEAAVPYNVQGLWRLSP